MKGGKRERDEERGKTKEGKEEVRANFGINLGIEVNKHDYFGY